MPSVIDASVNVIFKICIAAEALWAVIDKSCPASPLVRSCNTVAVPLPEPLKTVSLMIL